MRFKNKTKHSLKGTIRSMTALHTPIGAFSKEGGRPVRIVALGEFYAFLKSMETYRKVLTKDSTLVLSTDSDLFSLLKRSGAKRNQAAPLPPARPPSPQ